MAERSSFNNICMDFQMNLTNITELQSAVDNFNTIYPAHQMRYEVLPETKDNALELLMKHAFVLLKMEKMSSNHSPEKIPLVKDTTFSEGNLIHSQYLISIDCKQLIRI